MMSALTAAATGLAMVAVDFRTEALDLVPDPAGWLLVAYGAWRLAERAGAMLAVVAAVLSLSDVWLDFRYLVLDPVTYEVIPRCLTVLPCPVLLQYDQVGTARAAVIALTTAVGTLAVLPLLRRLARIDAGSPREHAVRRWARRIALLLPLAWTAPFLGVVAADTGADGRYQPFWDGGLAYLSPLLMLVLLGVAAFLLRASLLLGRSVEPTFVELRSSTWFTPDS